MPAALVAPVLAAEDAVTIGLSLLRREDQAIEGMADDEHATDAEEHPDEVPRHAFEDLAAVDIAADPK